MPQFPWKHARLCRSSMQPRPRLCSFRPTLEWLEGRLAPAVIPVTTTADDGPGSLRQAIMDANTSLGVLDTIQFNIGDGVQTIAVGSTTSQPLPTVTDPVVIDGTAPGNHPTQIIELNGAAAGTGAVGLTISAGNSTVQKLVINRFDGGGVELTQGGSNFLASNLIGTDPGGTVSRPNETAGVLILNSANNQIGGPTNAVRNVISGN